MEQEMVPNWPDDLVLNPEETRLNHMTVNPAEMSTDFPDMDDDMFSGLLPSLRYLPGLSVLQREFPMSTLAEPNPETQGQDIDMFSMHPFDPNQNHSQMSGLVGGTSQYALDYEVTTRQIPHHVQQGYEAPEYNNQDFNSHRLPQSFNQAYNQPPFSMSTSMTSNLPPNQASFSSEPSYFTSQDANSSQVKDVTPAIEPPNAPRAVAYLRRKEKTRYRRSISRATRSPLPSSSPGENRMYHRGTSNSSISEESQNSHHIDAQQELNLLEKSFKPTSSFAQRKKAHLLKELADKQAEVLRQLKELMIDDEKFGGSSDVESNDLLTSTVPSSKVSAATSEILESDESADNTSVSSTPRQLENIPTSIEDGQPPCKHKPCQKCGFSTLYHCTYKGCGHATHQFADFVRHEGGEGHWPQNRFMCLDCCPDPSNPAHKVPTDENGNPICVFCLLPFYLLPGTPKEHFLGCTTARNDATTFGRVDHLIEHRRSIHGIIGANKAKQKEINQTAASWKYPIESDWPRECRICGVRFTTWDERMKHLGEHFQEDFKKSKRPFLPPKDFAPGPGPSRKDEDEDDDDTPNGGNGGPRSYVAGQKGQSQTTRQSGVSGTSSSRSSQGQRTQGHQHIQTRDIYGNTPLHYLASSSSLALQRYLNDPDEPFATRWSLGLVPQYDNSSRVKHLLALIRDRQQHFASVDQHIESVPDTGRSQLQLVAKQSPGSSGVLQGSFAHRTHQRTFRLPSHGVKQSVYFEAATLLQHSHFISNLNTIPMTIVHWWEEATPPSVCKTISNGSTTDGPAISYGSKMGPGSPFSLHVRDLNTPEFSTHKAGVGTTDLVSIHDLGRNWNSSWPEKKSSALNWYLEHWHEDFELTRGDILVMLQYTAPKTREDYFKNVLSPTDREQMIQYWWSLFKFMKALTILHRGKPDDGCKDITQGFHQDIKPVNILLTINDSDNPFEGQFKLADLRISHFNRADQLQQNSTATDRQGTRTYGAPECYSPNDISENDRLRVGQNVDIWSLGCIYSEAARWLRDGYQGSLDNQRERGKESKGRKMSFGCDINIEKVDEILVRHQKMSTADVWSLGAAPSQVFARLILKQLTPGRSKWENPESEILQGSYLEAVDTCLHSSGTNNNNSPTHCYCQLCFKDNEFPSPIKHILEDVQQFTCMSEYKEPKSLKGKADLVRHEDEEHRHLIDAVLSPDSSQENYISATISESIYDQRLDKFGQAISSATGSSFSLNDDNFPLCELPTLTIYELDTSSYPHGDLSFPVWASPAISLSPSISASDYSFAEYSFDALPESFSFSKKPSGFVDPSLLHGFSHPPYTSSASSLMSDLPPTPIFSTGLGAVERSVLPGEFRSNSKSNRRYELKDIYNHVVEYGGDEHGSRFLQQKLETANSDDQEQFREIQPPSAYTPYPYPPPRRPSLSSYPSYSSGNNFNSEESEKGCCTYPGCGKIFKDLKAHMLTHQKGGPEKCPIQTCEYHLKGFGRKYVKNGHTLTHYKGTMVCGFCPGSGSASEKSFNRADLFKRHLTSVHDIKPTPPNSRKNTMSKANGTSSFREFGGVGSMSWTAQPSDATGKCSTCSSTFGNAQDFYEHLDDCVLRIVQQEELSEAIDLVRPIPSNYGTTMKSLADKRNQSRCPISGCSFQFDTASPGRWNIDRHILTHHGSSCHRFMQSPQKKDLSRRRPSYVNIADPMGRLNFMSEHLYLTDSLSMQYHEPALCTRPPDTVIDRYSQRLDNFGSAISTTISPSSSRRTISASDKPIIRSRDPSYIADTSLGLTVRRPKATYHPVSELPSHPRLIPSDSSPQHRPQPSYSVPVPPEKPAKALHLYEQYRLEDVSSQQPKSAPPLDCLSRKLRYSASMPSTLEHSQSRKIVVVLDNGTTHCVSWATIKSSEPRLIEAWGNHDHDTDPLRPRREPSLSKPLRASRQEPAATSKENNFEAFFKPGCVFTALWADPCSPDNPKEGSAFKNKVSRIHLPVATYGRKGHTKSGVNSNPLCVIHTSGTPKSPPDPGAIDQKWGKLFDREESSPNRFGRFLRGIANHIIDGFESPKGVVVTPSKLAKFYEKHHKISEGGPPNNSELLHGASVTSHAPYGCWIETPGLFDPRFFNKSPRKAFQIDPMQRMALSIAHEALEMSGYVPNRTRSTKLDRIGTFYRQTSDGLREISPAQEVDTYFISAGIKALGPGRINYYFGSLGNLGTAYSSNTLGQEANLALLLVREAQKLLLLELDRRESSSQDDIKFSMDLVQSMGFLPVGIHAIAQRLKAKDKPLSTFARGYTCTPRLRGLGTYTTAVDPPDRALEGLNLIHLLCYSSQHVPPEVAALISISESADFQKHGSVEDQAVHETLRNNLT